MMTVMAPTGSDGPSDPGSHATEEPGRRTERLGESPDREEPEQPERRSVDGEAPELPGAQHSQEPEGFTIGELAARAGVTARTIHYYVAEGLLPGPGKQGPRTRYAQVFLDLLLRIRHLQIERDLSLSTIRQMFEREGLVAARVRGSRRSTRSTRAASSRPSPDPDKDSWRRAEAEAEARTVAGEAGSRDRGGIPGGPTASDLLATLQSLVGERRVPSAGSGDRWVTIPISRDLVLAGRRLGKKEIQALQRAADYLRFVLLTGSRPGE